MINWKGQYFTFNLFLPATPDMLKTITCVNRLVLVHSGPSVSFF